MTQRISLDANNALSKEVNCAAIEHYRLLRPGWLENVYAVCLAAENRLTIHSAMHQTDLKLIDSRRSLSINFNVEVLHKGIKRIANDL